MRTAREWCDRSRPCHPIRSPPPWPLQSSFARPRRQSGTTRIIPTPNGGWESPKRELWGSSPCPRRWSQRCLVVCRRPFRVRAHGPRAAKCFPGCPVSSSFPGLCSLVAPWMIIPVPADGAEPQLRAAGRALWLAPGRIGLLAGPFPLCDSSGANGRREATMSVFPVSGDVSCPVVS